MKPIRTPEPTRREIALRIRARAFRASNPRHAVRLLDFAREVERKGLAEGPPLTTLLALVRHDDGPALRWRAVNDN